MGGGNAQTIAAAMANQGVRLARVPPMRGARDRATQTKRGVTVTWTVDRQLPHEVGDRTGAVQAEARRHEDVQLRDGDSMPRLMRARISAVAA